MIFLAAAPRPDRLTNEVKTGWNTGVTVADQRFVHCSNYDRLAGNLNPRFSTEWVMDTAENPILGGRLIFAFACVAGGDAPPQVPPPVRLMGNASFMYEFTAPAGTQFACQGGDFGHGPAGNLSVRMEVALPYIIENEDITTHDIAQPAVPAPAPAPAVGRCANCIIM